MLPGHVEPGLPVGDVPKVAFKLFNRPQHAVRFLDFEDAVAEHVELAAAVHVVGLFVNLKSGSMPTMARWMIDSLSETTSPVLDTA